MILDSRDIALLRLAGRYRWLPYENLSRFGFGSDFENEISILTAAGLIKISRDGKYMRLPPQGHKMLQISGYDYGTGTNKSYSNVSALRRRLETASIMLTALRAGIDVLPDNVDALRNQPMFYPAFDLRDGETNLMNAASCAGFGHWGNTGYIIEYVGTESKGMYLTNELQHLHNLSSIFSSSLKTPNAMIFAGSSYSSVYELLSGKTKSKRNGKNGFVDFWEVYRKSDMPIHLLSCDETGAMQLALMRQPDYNVRIAKSAFGGSWNPPDETFPEADGIIDGNPLIIAADMDIRRVERVCALARALNKTEVMVAAFRIQMEDFLFEILPKDGLVTPLSIKQIVLDNAFGKNFSLYSMNGGIAEGVVKNA